MMGGLGGAPSPEAGGAADGALSAGTLGRSPNGAPQNLQNCALPSLVPRHREQTCVASGPNGVAGPAP
jgi:hypothetical protein